MQIANNSFQKKKKDKFQKFFKNLKVDLVVWS